MRTLISISLLLLLITSAQAEQRSMVSRVTAYWKAEGGGLRACWNGARLHSGHCAVDPKKIPFGSKVVFPDAICIAVDSGPDVVNRKAARSTGRTTAQRGAIVIDRFFDTKAEAQQWIETHSQFMNVRVESPEQRARSTSTPFRLSLGLDAPVTEHLAIAPKPLPRPSARPVKPRA